MIDTNMHIKSKYTKLVGNGAQLEKLVINNPFTCAQIYLHGAHVTQYAPHGQADVLWLSQRAQFVAGKAIRGGIPICWPWFGPHPNNPQAPAHGFARHSLWQLVSVVDEQDATVVHLQLRADEQTKQWWPFEFILDGYFYFGQTLEVKLVTHNCSSQPMSISEAIHSYFAVGQIDKVALTHLAGTTYIDKLADNRAIEQVGDVTINGSVDRIYCHATNEQVIVDNSLSRQIRVTKSGAHDTVVWNPWQDIARGMADFDDLGYRHMLCVEAVNSHINPVTVAALDNHQITQTIALV